MTEPRTADKPLDLSTVSQSARDLWQECIEQGAGTWTADAFIQRPGVRRLLARAEASPTVEALAAALPEVTHDARVSQEYMDETDRHPDGSFLAVFNKWNDPTSERLWDESDAAAQALRDALAALEALP